MSDAEPRPREPVTESPASARGLLDEYRGGVAFQALELRMGGIPPEAGLVRYADEFIFVAGSVRA